MCPNCQLFPSTQFSKTSIVSFTKNFWFFVVERVLRYSPVLLVSEVALLGDVEADRWRTGYPDNMAVASQHTGQRSN